MSENFVITPELRRAMAEHQEAMKKNDCTCRDHQKQRALCPVCDREEYFSAGVHAEKMKGSYTNLDTK